MQEVKVTQLHNTTPQEFKAASLAGFKTEPQLFSKSLQAIEQPKYLTADEGATILKTAMAALACCNREAILNPHQLGNTITYKSNELDQVLIKINK